MLDPMRGLDDELMELIDGKQYFVIHAARQSGKTTLLLELAGLCVIYGEYKYPIEIKLLKGAKAIPEGSAQIAEYMDRVGEHRGSLVIFDRDAAKPWEEKIYMCTETVDGKEITIAGC